MTALECPHCHAYANFRQEWRSIDDPGHRFDRAPPFVCFTCDSCQFPVTAIVFDDDIHVYWPTATGKKEFPDVPERIAMAANEAHICLAAGAPLGAVALARAVVESVAKDKGINKGTLESKIDKLCDDGYISEAMQLAAHEIRFAGNEAAHGDLVAEPRSKEDADGIVLLMDSILHRVYQEPAQVARIRQERVERKAREASATEGTSNGPEEVRLYMPKAARLKKPGRLILE